MNFFGLFVHGVGQQTPDYADGARRQLRLGLEERSTAAWLESCHWADIADAPERRADARVRNTGAAQGPAQQLALGTAADALLYVLSPELRAKVWARMDAAHATFRGRPDVVIMAHSLGGLIATDWLRERPQVRVRALVTFGCNLEMFNLDRRFRVPEQLKPGGASWTNVFYPRDMLGWPLSGRPELSHVRDVKLPWELARPTTWTGLAHNAYWDCTKLWRELVPHWFA